MRHLLRFTSLIIQAAKVIGFLLFKVFVEPAEQAATKSNRPTINLKPKPTAKETVQETVAVPLETVRETVAVPSETVQETVGKLEQNSAIAIDELKPQIDTHKVCIYDLTPQLELVKPQVHDLTPQLEIPKPDIQSVVITDLDPEFADTDRGAEVNSTLEQAWSQGITTYKELIDYVKQQTGKGCSRRVVSEWKKSRNITEFAS